MLEAARQRVADAAEGSSNDEEIQALQDLVDLLEGEAADTPMRTVLVFVDMFVKVYPAQANTLLSEVFQRLTASENFPKVAFVPGEAGGPLQVLNPYTGFLQPIESLIMIDSAERHEKLEAENLHMQERTVAFYGDGESEFFTQGYALIDGTGKQWPVDLPAGWEQGQAS